MPILCTKKGLPKQDAKQISFFWTIFAKYFLSNLYENVRLSLINPYRTT